MVNPLVLGMLLVVAGIVFACLKRRKTCVGVLVAAVTWLWVWSMPLVAEALGASLESEFAEVPVEQFPQADAIILLGGGVSKEGEYLLEPLREYVFKYSYGHDFLPRTKIECAVLGNDAGIIGAAMLGD